MGEAYRYVSRHAAFSLRHHHLARHRSTGIGSKNREESREARGCAILCNVEREGLILFDIRGIGAKCAEMLVALLRRESKGRD
jgi:hypothetical protein